MSELGPIALEGQDQPIFLGNDSMNRSEYSQEIAYKIDEQIRLIIAKCHNKAKNLLKENRALVDLLVDLLIEQETIDGDNFRKIVNEFKLKKPVLVA
jgi:cell division protease FtsH